VFLSAAGIALLVGAAFCLSVGLVVVIRNALRLRFDDEAEPWAFAAIGLGVIGWALLELST
jgi:hypothetical protein